MDKRIVITLTFLFILSIVVNTAFAEEVLTWQDCVKESAKNHPDLISAKENIVQSQADKDISASNLFPQVTGSVSGQTAKTSARKTDTYTYGASATQLVFDGFKTIDEVKAASENIKASTQSYKFTSSAIRFRLRSAFVNMLRAQEMLGVAREIYDIRRSNLELITLRYESGLEHKGALLTAEANLAQAQFEIDQAERDLATSRRQLIKEMGRSKLEAIQVKGDFNVPAEKEKPDFELIAKNNPSLQQVVFQKNAAQYDIKGAYADYLPEIEGQFSTDRTSSAWPPQDDQWSTGLSLTLPIFEGGLRAAQVAKAKSAFRQFEASERSTRDGILSSLEQTWQALQSAVETAGVQQKVLIASEERSKIAEAQYSTGFLNYDNWTIIQDNLVNAKKNFLERRITILLAEASWIQAKGETLEYAQ